MSEKNFRFERIERLLKELEYEITRGMMEREIDETMGFQFIVPISTAIPDGIVMCEFRTRPAPRHMGFGISSPEGPRLKVIK